MNGKIAAAIVVSLFVGLGLSSVWRNHEARGQGQENEERVEYRVVVFTGDPDSRTQALTRDLNALARQGWEYVGPITRVSHTYRGGNIETTYVAFRRSRPAGPQVDVELPAEGQEP